MCKLDIQVGDNSVFLKVCGYVFAMWSYLKDVVFVAVYGMLGLRGDAERNDLSMTSIEIFAYAGSILVTIPLPLICWW